MRNVRVWLGDVKRKQTDAKLAAMKWGEFQRDMVLLNYSRRTNFDRLAGMVFPYQFWYTRSMLNWAQRAIDQLI